MSDTSEATEVPGNNVLKVHFPRGFKFVALSSKFE